MANEWLTGAMIVDMVAVEIFMRAKDAINSPADSGVAVVFLPVETSAAIQAEVNSSDDTGSSGGIGTIPWSGGGVGGGTYPI